MQKSWCLKNCVLAPLDQPVPTTISDTLVSGIVGMSAQHLAVAAPADIAVSRNLMCFWCPIVSLHVPPMLREVNPSHALEVTCMCVHSGVSLQFTTPTTSHQAHQR